MSSFFDDLEAQLHAAARARSGARHVAVEPPPRRSRRTWLRAGARTAPLVVAVSTAIAVVVAALVLVGHGHRQPPSPPASPPPAGGLGPVLGNTPPRQLRQELSYIGAATKQVMSSPACQVAQPPRASFIHGFPGHQLLSILGVLRRPATPADRLSASLTDFGAQKIYAGHTRLARVAAGTSYYIVPTRANPAVGSPPARCFALQVTALQRERSNIPAALWPATRSLQARLLAYVRGLAAHGPYDTICLVTVSRNSSGGGCGDTAATIEHGSAGTSDDQGTFSGLVPDGVASVTLRFPSSHGRAAHSVTAAVIGNIFAVHVGVEAHTGRPPDQPAVIWRSAQGRVLKTIPVPSAAAAARYCRQHPIPCIAVTGISESSSSSGSATTSTTSATATTR
jgi:hypothetical protein